MAAAHSKVGIFWADNAFIFVISSKDSPPRVFHYPFSQDPTYTPRVGLDDDLKFVALIQKFVQDQGVTTKDVHLSLPAKDIILRSFIVPSVKPNEVEGLVQFEIKKYIPFPLENLEYTYHAIPLENDEAKKLRVLFAGIRKDIFAKYREVLRKAGLTVRFSEPGPVSLVRLLLAKKVIDVKQKVAILQTSNNLGRIIIVDHGIPQFIREFQLQVALEQDEAPNDELIKAKLYNEVQISLDFFARQYAEEDVADMIALTYEDAPWLDGIGEGLDLRVKKVNPQSLVDMGITQHIGALNAVGSILHEKQPSPGNFNFSEDKSETHRKKFSYSGLSEEYKKTFQIICVSLLVVVLAKMLTGTLLKEKHKRVEVLREHQGVFIDLTIEDIQEKTRKLKNKQDAFGDVRLGSDVAYFLANIPKVIPEASWLTRVEVYYSEEVVKSAASDELFARKHNKLSMQLEGQVYHPDKSTQIPIVNSIIPRLKEDPIISKIFETIKLNSVKANVTEDFDVTDFTVELN